MADAQNNQKNQQQDLNQILKVRREKLAALQEAGKDPFRHVKYDVTAHSKDIVEGFEELEGKTVRLAGRMMSKRIMGKASFCTVRDFTGTMQYFVQQNEVGSDAYAAFKTFDLGDIVAAKGVLFRTHAGDLAIRVKEIRLMTKSIRPLPDKHKGLQDTELCYRQRYVDLIMNEESRNRFLTRSKAIAAIRAFMLLSLIHI